MGKSEQQILGNVGIACGYGVMLNDSLKSYLKFVLKHICSENISTLLVTGGYTSKGSNISEARVMADFIGDAIGNTEVVKEDRALTTLHNLLYSRRLIQQCEFRVDKLYIFCDSVRALKVALLSRIVFANYRFLKVVKFRRKQAPFFVVIEILNTLIQVLGAVFPVVEKGVLLAGRLKVGCKISRSVQSASHPRTHQDIKR